ncbi:MAG: hypothetical protein KAI74_06620 [Kiritimatiellae bacterium]|nr:hypothetical protein [Kiritimatiellia bacterium]
MNLQVDLILTEEQRNASAFNMQALLRILSVIGPAIIVLIIILLVINVTQTKGELKALEAQWQLLEVKKGKADKLRNQISTNNEILSKFKGINTSRLEWHSQLRHLMESTPSTIQFRNLSASQTLTFNDRKKGIRKYRVLLAGKAIGDKIDITIANFTRQLSESPKLSPYIDGAKVTAYDKDNSVDAGKNDRVFKISCTYKPRTFE